MKRMPRILLLILAALLSLLLCAGCASQSSAPQDGGVEAPAAEPDYAYDIGNDAAAREEAGVPPFADITGKPQSSGEFGEKLIYTAQMRLESADVAQTLKQLTDRAQASGGYVASSSLQEDYAYLTVRIPVQGFSAFIDDAGAMAKLLSSQMSTQDVTGDYYDIQARLKNAQAQEAQLLELLKQAKTVEETLLVREQLSIEQGNIEAYQGRLKLMDNLVAYSTVEITLTRQQDLVSNPSDDVQIWSFAGVLDKMGQGVRNTGRFLVNATYALLIGLSYLLIPALIVGIVVLVVLVLVRLARRRKNRKQK